MQYFQIYLTMLFVYTDDSGRGAMVYDFEKVGK